jgi:glycosyltransferase involved in cell wall biosynthesis
MINQIPLNIFYQEPDPDRWFKYDRYLRKIIRRIFRGKPRPGGQMMVAINLMKGLDKLGVPYRFNDYKYARKHPNEIIGVIGKPHLIFEKRFKNPILFGASVFSHPIDKPKLLEEFPNIKKILVPGPWIKNKFDEYYGGKNIIAWPVGIDTHTWNKQIKKAYKTDFLIYDKVRWDHDEFEKELINPIIDTLKAHNLTYDIIRYGSYNPNQLKEKVANCKAVIFLCEHETQGIAYQQILATNTPILAWDRGGFWQDPSYYPHKVKFQPVSSVPYWDSNCGEKFKKIEKFENTLKQFLIQFENYQPEKYILQNLSLEKCAQAYTDIYNSIAMKNNV